MCGCIKGRYRMNFKVFRLDFTGAVHFGEGGLITSADTLMADTVFSALCVEAAAQGDGLLKKLVDSVTAGKLLISDGLPYIGATLYVPKPMVEVRVQEEGNSKIKKDLKKLRYIPVEKLGFYLNGQMEIGAEAKAFQDGFSVSDLAEKVTVPGNEVTRPYAVAVKRYKKGSGLYLCVGYADEETVDLFRNLLHMLSYSGIGGERSSGYGRFRVVSGSDAAAEAELTRRLQMRDTDKYMSLSVCLPNEDELDEVVEGASYLAVRRGGWVGSASYADTMRKKREIYMFAAGATFAKRYAGGIYDVSEGGRHPVYRYGKPMLMSIC